MGVGISAEATGFRATNPRTHLGRLLLVHAELLESALELVLEEAVLSAERRHLVCVCAQASEGCDLCGPELSRAPKKPKDSSTPPLDMRTHLVVVIAARGRQPRCRGAAAFHVRCVRSRRHKRWTSRRGRPPRCLERPQATAGRIDGPATINPAG